MRKGSGKDGQRETKYGRKDAVKKKERPKESDIVDGVERHSRSVHRYRHIGVAGVSICAS